MSTLHFNISGEYITDLARTWFWDERRPIQTCIELIGTCICNGDQQTIKDITIAILEGRKKFTGINEFELADDNENIRSIADYVANRQKEETINKIKLDMIASFDKYMDKWATIKSSHPDVLALVGNPTSYEECRNYYTTTQDSRIFAYTENLTIEGKDIIETPTMGGLWLIREPELVYDACNGEMHNIGSTTFWDYIYESKKDDPDFAERSMRYRVSRRPKPSFEERIESLMKYLPDTPDSDTPYLSDQWFAEEYQKTQDINYITEPDDIQRWEGLIAPNGDFYSCNFGGHNQKAYYLLVKHPEWINKTRKEVIESQDIRMDNSLDILFQLNWGATRSVVDDHYLLPAHPTKRQIETILTAAEKHDAAIYTKDLLSYL